MMCNTSEGERTTRLTAAPVSNTLAAMAFRLLLVGVWFSFQLMAQLQTGPPLPHRLVKDWAQLPQGWNFGECSGVAVDKNDNVWVFNRGPHPVVEFDKNG